MNNEMKLMPSLIILLGIIQKTLALQMAMPSELFTAVKKKDYPKIRSLILAKKALNDGNRSLRQILECISFPHTRTPLLQATINDDVEAVKILVEAGANIFAHDLTGVTPFYLACYRENKEIFKALMRTPSKAHVYKIESLFLEELRILMKYEVSKIPHISSFVSLFITNNKKIMGSLSYNWLHKLAEECRHEKSVSFKVAQTYKNTAQIIMDYYTQQRWLAIFAMKHDPHSYFFLLPKELRHMAIDFLLKGTEQMNNEYNVIIEKKCVH